MFGGEFGEFDLGGGEFGGGMEDIEVPRNTRSIGFGDEKDITNENKMQVSDFSIFHTINRTPMMFVYLCLLCICVQVSDVTNGTTLLDGSKKGPGDFNLEDRRLDAINDFGGGGDFLDGFGAGDEGMVDLGDLPGVSDINLDEEPPADNGEQALVNIIYFINV